jgi:hypothetical protein
MKFPSSIFSFSTKPRVWKRKSQSSPTKTFKRLSHGFKKIREDDLTEYVPDNLIADTMNAGRHDKSRMRVGDKEFQIHVSDLIKVDRAYEFCAREHALNFLDRREEYGRGLTPGFELLFELGHAIHRLVRWKFLRFNKLAHAAWGRWMCDCEDTIVTGFKPAVGANVCKRCGSTPHKYEEYRIHSKEYRLVGHPDFLLRVKRKGGKYRIIIYEIKTLDRKDIDFDRMTYPLGDHTLQASFYYWMLREEGFDVDPNIRYLYVDRSTSKLWFGYPYKEFTLRASPIDRLQPFLAKAKVLLRAMETGELPPRICPNATCARAKNCKVAVTCFNRRSNRVAPPNPA